MKIAFFVIGSFVFYMLIVVTLDFGRAVSYRNVTVSTVTLSTKK